MKRIPPPTRKGKRWYRFIRHRWFLRSILIAIPVASIACWMAVHYVPVAYIPVRLSDEEVERIRLDATHLFDGVSDALAQGRPCTITLNSTQINELIAAAPRLWPEPVADWPSQLGKPHVELVEDQLQLMVPIKRGNWSAILTLGIAIKLNPDDASIVASIDSTHLGAVPILKRFVEGTVRSILSKRQSRFKSGRHSARIKETAGGNLGISVLNEFVWPNGKRRFRVDRIELDADALKLVLTPC